MALTKHKKRFRLHCEVFNELWVRSLELAQLHWLQVRVLCFHFPVLCLVLAWMFCTSQASEFFSFTLVLRDHKKLKNIVDSLWVPFLHATAAGMMQHDAECYRVMVQMQGTPQPKLMHLPHQVDTTHQQRCSCECWAEVSPQTECWREQSSSVETAALVVQCIQHTRLSRPVLQDCCAFPHVALSCLAWNGLSPNGSFSILRWW